MTVALEGGEWSAARPGRTLPPEKTRYPFYRRLGGPQGRSGRAENLVPTGDNWIHSVLKLGFAFTINTDIQNLSVAQRKGLNLLLLFRGNTVTVFVVTDGRTADTECYSEPQKNLTVVDRVMWGWGGGGRTGSGGGSGRISVQGSRDTCWSMINCTVRALFRTNWPAFAHPAIRVSSEHRKDTQDTISCAQQQDRAAIVFRTVGFTTVQWGHVKKPNGSPCSKLPTSFLLLLDFIISTVAKNSHLEITKYPIKIYL